MGKTENARCLSYRESRTVTAERLGPTLGVCLRDVSCGMWNLESTM